jgi:hypothetical protein
MSFGMFAAEMVSRGGGGGSKGYGEKRLMAALEQLATVPGDLGNRLRAVCEEDLDDGLRSQLRLLSRLGVRLTYSLADAADLYKAYLRLYGPYPATLPASGPPAVPGDDIRAALSAYMRLLTKMAFYQELVRRVAAQAQAEVDYVEGRTEELKTIAEAYKTRTDAVKTAEGSGYLHFVPGNGSPANDIATMLTGAVASAPTDQFFDPTNALSATALPDFKTHPKVAMLLSDRLDKMAEAHKPKWTTLMNTVTLYDAETVNSLGYEPVLTDRTARPSRTSQADGRVQGPHQGHGPSLCGPVMCRCVVD